MKLLILLFSSGSAVGFLTGCVSTYKQTGEFPSGMQPGGWQCNLSASPTSHYPRDIISERPEKVIFTSCKWLRAAYGVAVITCRGLLARPAAVTGVKTWGRHWGQGGQERDGACLLQAIHLPSPRRLSRHSENC